MSARTRQGNPTLRRAVSAGFSLIELLVASGIIALTVTGFYTVFLRANDYAICARCNTAAKIILESTVNLALTTQWPSQDPAFQNANGQPTLLLPTTGLYSSPVDASNADCLLYNIDGTPDQQTAVSSNCVQSVQEPSLSDGTPAIPAIGQVLLFTDPNGNPEGNIVGSLRRKVVTDPTLQGLVKITFKIDYTFRGRRQPPIYSYTLRTRDK